MRNQSLTNLPQPWISVDHPDFKWTPGADVQQTWRKYGWTPPSDRMTPPIIEKEPEPFVMRRVK